MNQSRILRGILKGGEARFFLCDTTAIAQEARTLHNASNTCTAAMGRMLSAVSMMGIGLKDEQDRISATISGGGPAGAMTAVAGANGVIKITVENPGTELPLKANGAFDVGGYLGKNGQLTVIRSNGFSEPYIGRTNLVSGEIGEDFAFVPLMTERLMLVAAKDDPFPLEHLCMDTPTPYVNLSAFRDKPFILGDPAQKSRKVCDEVFEQLGFKPWILLQSQYNRTSILLASQGIGYALVPSSIRGTQESLAYYPIDPLLHNSWTIGVTWLKTRRLSHSALQLKQIVVEILKQPDLET